MEIRRLKVKDIAVEVYQRSLSSAHLNRIVRDFDDRLLGLPVVSLRNNGSMYVIDGQHRLAALAKLGIAEVDCQVLRQTSTQAEAEMFVKVNTIKKGLNGVDKFFALLEANNASAISCKALFARHGWELVRGSTTRVENRGELAMRPNAATLAVFNESPVELEIALKVLVEAFPTDADGIRSAAVAEHLVKFNLIGGLAVAISSWVKQGQWSGVLRTALVETLSRAQLTELTNPQIPRSLAGNSNVKRVLGAVALVISQLVANRSRKTKWKLTPDQISAISSDKIARSFAVAY